MKLVFNQQAKQIGQGDSVKLVTKSVSVLVIAVKIEKRIYFLVFYFSKPGQISRTNISFESLYKSNVQQQEQIVNVLFE